MSTPKVRKPPAVVERDPIAEQRQAESLATTRTNEERVLRRRRRAGNSLLTAGPQGSGASQTAGAYAMPGASLLGGG